MSGSPAPTVPIDGVDLALAASLLLLHGVASLLLQLRLEREMAIAAVRMVIQLLLVGLVLKWLFAAVSPWLTLLTAVVMIGFAGFEITARQEQRLAGGWSLGLGTGAMLFATLAVTVFGLGTQVRPDPWYDPRYSIPLLGMILGNTMNGVSLGLHTLTTGARRERASIEAQLCLGATRFAAMRPLIRHALRTGLMPIVNSMAATGLVSLPGMMTGQILAGAAPMEAVRYQMLIMFWIAGGTALGAVAAVLGGVLRLTDDRHRLRLDRLAGGDRDA